MRLAATAFVFSALALGQPPADQPSPSPTAQAPDKLGEALKERLSRLKLIDPAHPSLQQMTVDSKPKACAIPLLNALPANGKIDYKIRTFKPSANFERGNMAAPQIGLPACEPGRFTLKPLETEKK